MKNHILAIEGLSIGENGEASEYVKQVIESIDKTSFRFQTNSKIITTLVNSKMEQTEKRLMYSMKYKLPERQTKMTMVILWFHI